MEVSVVAPTLSLSSFCVFPSGSAVSDVLERFVPQQDFYVTRNGRLSPLDQRLQHGAVYHLEPRLCGGKGGFGSMLRALGAQIEKTTNREACRDLSGRRLRDVNHEKEMAEWLKKQAEREAEKEQRRLERLQRKLAEPKHQFSDPQYQKQCHDLSERLEDSVLKGLQASSSAQVMPDEVSAAKRPNPGESKEPLKKKKKKEEEGVAMGSFWTGLGELDELLSSEDEDEDEELSSPSTSSSSCRGAGVAMARRGEEAGPELGGSSSDCSSSSTGPAVRPLVGKQYPETSSHSTKSPSEDQKPAEPISETPVLPSKVQKSPEPVSNTPVKPSGDQKPAEPVSDSPVRAPKVQTPPEPVSEKSVKAPKVQTPPEPVSEKSVKAPKVQTPPEPVSDTPVMPSKDQKAPESSGSSEQLDLTSLTSVQQLEVLGLDALKEQLMLRGLKCGGTLPERAARLFSVRGLTAAQIDPALLAKPAKGRRK